ncbi:hypothetical protein H4S08_000175 [Coemansia sp. RSA 1365]|nr:hypothetical protein H4S08_000175 [Coemansia sp. RSA 1365]
MSESPSIYMPRQLRPRRMPQSQNARGESSREVTSGERRVELQISKTHHHTHNYGILSSQQPGVVAKGSPQVPSTRRMAESIDSIRQRAATAVSISGFLGRQLHDLASQPYFSQNEPAIYAYLLGYFDGDGFIHLNRLDRGIQHGTDRIPTMAHNTDIFISINANTRVSMEPALPIELDGMAELLEHLHRGPNIGCGPLRRKGYKESYIYDCGPLLPPAHAVWVAGNPETDETPIQSAYVDSGMPISLHIALVYPEDSYQSARVRHFSVASAKGEPAIYVRLAAAELVSSSDISTIVARFTSLDQCNQDLTRALYAAASQNRMSIADQFERALASPPQKHKSSPLLEKIVSSTKAIVTQSPRHTLPARARSPDMVPTLQTKVGASSTPCLPAARSDGNTENSDIAELLKEQRQIRMLLEQQNSLIKSHVSQTQELIRMTKHQSSPQTITRRYLRMKGTHTPSLLGIQRRTSDTRDMATTGETPETHSMRRSNSLSEIVDGIRSFEVEGYEETEHHVGHGYQRRLSFTSPMNVGSTESTLESPSQAPSVASGSLSSSSGITSLVTRINRIVSNSTNMAPAASNAFERPPVPAYSRVQGRSLTYDHKITPTTQKYLDTLESQGALQPAQKRSLNAGPDIS